VIILSLLSTVNKLSSQYFFMALRPDSGS